MTPEDMERLEELEDLLEMEGELDEDDREELNGLRDMRREEKRQRKELAKFDKAHTVYRVTIPRTQMSQAAHDLKWATAVAALIQENGRWIDPLPQTTTK